MKKAAPICPLRIVWIEAGESGLQLLVQEDPFMCNNNGWGGNCCWIIILLIIVWCCCGNNNGCGNNNWGGCGCGGNQSTCC